MLKSWEEKLSMSYVRNDRRVRRRIVDDEVEFAPELWDALDTGAPHEPLVCVINTVRTSGR